jgi:hypothetical protein
LNELVRESGDADYSIRNIDIQDTILSKLNSSSDFQILLPPNPNPNISELEISNTSTHGVNGTATLKAMGEYQGRIAISYGIKKSLSQ